MVYMYEHNYLMITMSALKQLIHKIQCFCEIILLFKLTSLYILKYNVFLYIWFGAQETCLFVHSFICSFVCDVMHHFQDSLMNRILKRKCI